jgi:phosphatidylinositol alpha-1,6-mannosyltransferase
VKRILYGLYDQFAKRELLNQFDHFIALTDSEKERFVALGVDPRKISVIPNGVDDECFQKIDPTAFRKKFGLTGKKVILFMGILKRIKRCDLLIRALPEIARRVPDVLVLLVGPDAGEYAKVKDIAEHLKVSNHFKWIGPLYGKEKHQAYSAADFLILPSDEEGFPRVLLEAMAHAKAVIGTDTVGSSAIILDQVTGFVTTRGSVEDIVTAALRLLTNPMLCEKMGRKARDVAIAKYQISQVVERLEALYYRLAAVKGNPKARG